MAATAYSFDEVEFDGPPPVACEWFALCPEGATHMVSHPVLDWVPTCDKHTQFAQGG